MKKGNRFFIFFIALIFLVLPLLLGFSTLTHAGEIQAKKGQYITIKGNSWNIRARADVNAKILLSANPGASFKILDIVKGEDGQNWYKIRVLNNDAYIVASTDFTISDTYEDSFKAENIKVPEKEGPADSDFENMIASFPESYKPYLRLLHKDFPKWTFEIYNVNSTFAAAVENEASVEARNLITNSSNYPDSVSMIKNMTVYDGGGYVAISKDATAFFMDPRNFLNKVDIFQFESMTGQIQQTVEGVKSLFKDNNDLLEMAAALYQICSELNLNAYTMASRIKLEVGINNGVTNIAKGRIDPKFLPIHPNDSSLNLLTKDEQRSAIERYEKQLNFRGSELPARYMYLKDLLESSSYDKVFEGSERYYNVANIGAYPNVGFVDGAAINALYYAMGYNTGLSEEKKAYYELPWNSQEKAIRGAVKWISEQYIDQGQDTVYFQKWDVVGDTPRFWHQYMGSVLAPIIEGKNQYKLYSDTGLVQENINFKIPVYLEMPDEPAPNPITLPEVSENKETSATTK